MVFDYLKEYITFRSVEEMDDHIAKHISRYSAALTDSDVAVIRKIASHALTYPGVAHLKAETIAHHLYISTKTVYRAVAKLGELNIVKRVPTKKLNGIKGANIYCILPFVPSTVSERANVGETDSGAVSKPLQEDQSFSSFNLSETSYLYNVYVRLQDEKERRMAYLNDYQQALYELLMGTPIKEELKEGLYQAIVASDMPDCRAFVQTRDALMGIIQDVQSGKLTINTTLRAVLQGIMLKTPPIGEVLPPASETQRRKVEFYDWLTERE